MSTKLTLSYSPKFRKQLQQLATQHPNYAKRCKLILNQLKEGTPYTLLGGKYLRCSPSSIRFKLGQRYRLLVCKDLSGWKSDAVLSHESYNKILKRRR